jgi:tRNA (guanine26-N2/guanine27-N2)-dimethyltransferase
VKDWPRRKLELITHLEGRTRLFVPKASITSLPPPTSPVFFNPAASLNRDITVAVSSAVGGGTFCDAMAGVGARGVRVANEVEGVSEVAMVDFNKEALALARRSAALNGVGRFCSFTQSETSSYLFGRYGRDMRFGFVDVDPFGSPVRQMAGGLTATADGGILSITATDTAVLCGVHPSTCSRRYGASSINNSFHHETGLRILVGALARNAGAIDVGIEPVVAHSTRHYLRAFVRVRAGASAAESSMKELGTIAWCPACGDVQGAGGGTPCRVCGKKLKTAGPLWKGAIVEESLINRARKRALKVGLAPALEVFESLIGVNDFPPWSFDIDGICSELKLPTVPERSVYLSLAKAGFRAMRTPFEKTGVKTDASYREVARAVQDAKGPPRGEGRPSSLHSSSRARS